MHLGLTLQQGFRTPLYVNMRLEDLILPWIDGH